MGTERWLGFDPTLSEIRELSYTALHKFDASERGQTTYRASGEVPGYLLNQWSLSEHKGVLRVATSNRPTWWGGRGESNSQSAVRTFEERDGRLVEIGRSEASGRASRSSRCGSWATSATWSPSARPTRSTRSTSPSRAHPAVPGELKIPGYSAYLHPLGDGRLLGVGQDATSEGARPAPRCRCSTSRDPARPDSPEPVRAAPRLAREAEGDHHSFLWWAPERLAMVP